MTGRDAVRQAALAEARRWLGTPYQHQQSCQGAGTDCLGLVRGVWRHLHGTEPAVLPAYTPDWSERAGGEILLEAAQCYLEPVSEARPGDVLLFRPDRQGAARHCAILAAPDRIIHAYWGRAVAETALTPWWQTRRVADFAFPLPEDIHG